MYKFAKMRKKTILILLSFLGIIILLCVLIPPLGKLTPELVKKARLTQLKFWHQQVEKFHKDNNRLPHSLYELHITLKGRDTAHIFYPFEDTKDAVGKLESMDTPEGFYKLTIYGFYSNQQGWFVRELRSDDIYPYMLMIDQDGKIYEIKEINDD